MSLFGPRYAGARFYKCDLHMHTPLDRHWRDEATRLSTDDSDERKSDVARQYLRACHEAGLQVIGITDHNFARAADRSFVRYLRAQNEGAARDSGCQPLVILPGFEIEADVGRGFHVVCLFDPRTDLAVVDSRLTSCDLPPDKRFKANGEPTQSTKRLPEIIETIQNATHNPGLEIAAHPASVKGMLNDDVAEMWLQQEEFRNPTLLCIEVPKPLEALSKGWQALLGGGKGCQAEWLRERPIACVRNSDSYHLYRAEGITSNYIGFRFTWVKMSEPSIEGLRQAFLDHDSRIRLLDSSPEDLYVHPLIQSVKVTGAEFYKAAQIDFSPNLNTIIGSRGAGKSTLLDYMRLALDRLREGDLPPRLRDEIVQKADNTLANVSSIVLDFVQSGTPYRLEYLRPSNNRVITRLDTGESQPDWTIRELLPVRVLSQREIDQSVDPSDQAPLRRLLDDFIAPQLAALFQLERETKSKVQALDVALQSKQQGQALRASAVTQRLDLENRLKRLDSVRVPLEHWTTIEKENRFVGLVSAECESAQIAVQNAIDALAPVNDHIIEQSPREELLRHIHGAASNAMDALKTSLSTTLGEFRKATTDADSALQQLIREGWAPTYADETRKYMILQGELEEKGDKPQDYLRLKAQLTGVSQQIEQLDQERQELTELEMRRIQYLNDLRRTWGDQSKCRIAKAEDLMNRLRPLPGAKPLVEIEIAHQGDAASLTRIWSSRLGDRRKLNESDLRAVIDWCTSQPSLQSLPERLLSAVHNPDTQTTIQGLLSNRAKAFYDIFPESTLRQLELERADDSITYRVYREDGSLAGPIENVSAGQKGLAFLNLLLASGDMPLIVDTPEEGLDNEGVYTELVPIFRREKEKRQIFVVTHNANVPVNADAELIACLEPSGTMDVSALKAALGRAGGPTTDLNFDHLVTLFSARDWGRSVSEYLSKRAWPEECVKRLLAVCSDQRVVEGRLRRSRIRDDEPLKECVGALDTPVVKRAVQDIMEGSERAFLCRQEKYGF